MSASVQIEMPWLTGPWRKVDRCDARARALVDGESFGEGPHYSRQTPGGREFMGSGRLLVLLTPCGRAVWGAIENMEPGSSSVRWRCSVFRNEGAGLSSALILAATQHTIDYWRARWGRAPSVRLTTEVDPGRVRRKRDPGRCFRRAGWEYLYTTDGARRGRADLMVFGAPVHSEAAE